MECPTHAKSKPKFAKTYLFGLVTGLPYIGQWNPQFVLQMISERNDVAQRREPFAWSDFLPQFLPSTFENWQSKFFATPLASAGVGNVYFGVALSRESDDRLEAKIERLLSEDGIDPAHFDDREEAGVQAKA
jgi:hypothetical protein